MRNQILRLTATEAARGFSRLLDRIQEGAEAIIERHSEPVARVVGAAGTPRRISECMAVRIARPSVAPDPDFARDLQDIIKGNPVGEVSEWE